MRACTTWLHRSSDAASPTTAPTARASTTHELPPQPLTCLVRLKMRGLLLTATGPLGGTRADRQGDHVLHTEPILPGFFFDHYAYGSSEYY